MNKMSPKFQMCLINTIDSVMWSEFETYKNVKYYIEKWHVVEEDWNSYWENFAIILKKDSEDIDLQATLHNIESDELLQIAIDLGIETPDFIPSIPTFRNKIKSSYATASSTFEKAFKQIEEHPDIAIGLANSALESIIKEILKDNRVKVPLTDNDTLRSLIEKILKYFQLYPNSTMPIEIKTLGSSLLAVANSVEDLRSTKTNFHGKTNEDYVVQDSTFAYFVVNSVSSVGLFLIQYFENRFKMKIVEDADTSDDLPF